MTGETPPASSCRVSLRALDWNLTAAEVLRLVRDDPYPVALLGTWAGGRDIVASDPLRVRSAPGPAGKVLDAPLAGASRGTGRTGAVFGGGWIGYLGFGVAEQMQPVPRAPGEPRQLPAWWFGYYDHVLRRDQITGLWVFEALWTPGRADALERRFAELSRRARAGGVRPRRFSSGSFRMVPSPDEYRAAVRQTVSYIRRGDIFQANICLRLDAEFSGDPLDAFCHAVDRLSPPYAAFIGFGHGAVASMSPELFLRRTGTSVLSQPIKGTRPRPEGTEAAGRERDALVRSVKDRAENMMIVDLMRNDLSRVCLPGSVQVPARLRAEPHPGVWHLVSDVRGALPAGTGDGPLVAAAFPPGSVTGAPKVRALETIHELEATAREVYTGAIGYRSPLAGLELNVAIRTFEFAQGRVWLGSGGGITAASDPEGEYRECLAKAAPLIRSLGASLSEGAGTRAGAAGPGVAGIGSALRPRPAAGVFTSLRVADGSGYDLEAHLARLDDSAWQLFGKHLPRGLPAQLAACLAGRPSGRLRIVARPVGGPLQVTTEVTPVGPAPVAVVLRTVTVPGGLGDHKWRDRRLLAAISDSAGAAPGDHLLIQDSDGEILETDRANVFAVIGGVLYTPPADGRLLPGITRGAVLLLAEQDGMTVKKEPLSRQRLLEASEVFVTNSVQGIMPVRSLAGTATAWAEGSVARQLQAALARRPAASTVAGPPVSRKRSQRTLSARTGRPAVVVVDNYDSFTYNLTHLLLAGGCQVEVVRNDEVAAHDIAAFGPAGIVISPGPGAPADAGISIDTVRACAATTPLLGICLGHQVIAAAYGATITTAPQSVHGRAGLITHDGRGVLKGLPQRFRAGRYHSLIVDEESMPAELAITARGPGGIPMALRHTQHPAEGLQFHPESILTSRGRHIIRNFVTAVLS